MLGLRERAEELLEKLKFNAGLDPLQDRYTAGYLAAFGDIINTSYEEISE